MRHSRRRIAGRQRRMSRRYLLYSRLERFQVLLALRLFIVSPFLSVPPSFSLSFSLIGLRSRRLTPPSSPLLAVNLLRTRLQASGSSGHPHQYTGFRDVMQQTLKNEGWRGLYKGLLPSILKVGPAVGVSWIVYEESKRMLGV